MKSIKKQQPLEKYEVHAIIWNLKNREPNYFNDEDYYLFLTNLGQYYVTKMHKFNGHWFTNVGMRVKGTSVVCINCRELIKKTVKLKETELTGQITKFLQPDQIGINWYNGKEVRKYGLPNYWNNVKNLKIW